MNGVPLVVLGVMPRNFDPLLSKSDIWIPAAYTSTQLADHDDHYLQIFARLKDGVSIAQARAEMNVLVMLNTCQHPLDPNPAYQPRPALLSILPDTPAGPDDACRLSRPENARGFTLTERYFL